MKGHCLNEEEKGVEPITFDHCAKLCSLSFFRLEGEGGGTARSL